MILDHPESEAIRKVQPDRSAFVCRFFALEDVDRPLARDTPLSDSPAGFEVKNSLPFDIDLVVTPIF